MSTILDKSKAQRLFRYRHGRCQQCGRWRESALVNCARCRKLDYERKKRLIARWIASGRCRKCGKGRWRDCSLCRKCLDRENRNYRKRRYGEDGKLVRPRNKKKDPAVEPGR